MRAELQIGACLRNVISAGRAATSVCENRETVMSPAIRDKLPQVVDLCRRHHVKRLDLFGSATRDAFDTTQGDVDLLVEYLPEATHGFAGDFFGLKSDLEALLACEVDLVIGSAIRNPYFRAEVEATKVPIYAA